MFARRDGRALWALAIAAAMLLSLTLAVDDAQAQSSQKRGVMDRLKSQQAQEQAQDQAASKEPPKTLVLTPPSVTKHSITVNGKKIDYTATVGYVDMKDQYGKVLAHMFYTAYVKDGEDALKRPLTFAFNGGPGSSSIYLHMLTLGPRRAKLTPEGNTLGPPPEIVDNDYTWLEFTDVVMIDPISTGYSRAEAGVDLGIYHGVYEDAESIANFIRLYLQQNDRWLSPIFIAGESYGGVRGPVLAEELQNNREVCLNVNGLIFISPAFDMQALFTDDSNPIAIALYMPTYATTAYYHKKLAPELQSMDFQAFVDEVREWALTEFYIALMRGDRLSDEDMKPIAEKMARYCGLSLEYVMLQRMRIDSYEFREELLRTEGKSLDRLDARWETGAYELTTTLSPVLHHYLKAELGYDTDNPYSVSATNLRNWNMGMMGMALSVMPNLSRVMHNNRQMKVLVTMGYYDYACPYFTIDYAIDQLGLKPELRDNVIRRYYQTGHMVYTPLDELARFTKDVKEFILMVSER